MSLELLAGAPAWAVLAWLIADKALLTWRRVQADRQQQAEYGNGSVKDAIHWRGETLASIQALASRVDAVEEQIRISRASTDRRIAALHERLDGLAQDARKAAEDVAYLRGRVRE